MRHVADDSMDAVVTTMALSRADNAKNMLAEIIRVLAPGGKYYFWEPVDFPEGEDPMHPHHPRSPTSPGGVIKEKDGSNSPSSPTPKSPSGGVERNPFVFQRQFSTVSNYNYSEPLINNLS
jgi:SAM-dependent methyltransferase